MEQAEGMMCTDARHETKVTEEPGFVRTATLWYSRVPFTWLMDQGKNRGLDCAPRLVHHRPLHKAGHLTEVFLTNA